MYKITSKFVHFILERIIFLLFIVILASINSNVFSQIPDSVRQSLTYEKQTPFAVKIDSQATNDGVRVSKIRFKNGLAKNSIITALLIEPLAKTKHPAILYQHWGYGNKSEFLSEAIEMAKAGFVSISIDAPYLAQEDNYLRGFYDYPEVTRIGIINILRGIDFLSSFKEVDPSKIFFVGHSFGATLGGPIRFLAPKLKGLVLMAGVYSISNFANGEHQYFSNIRKQDTSAFAHWSNKMRPYDSENFIKHPGPPVYHQYGSLDKDVTRDEANKYIACTAQPFNYKFYETGHELNEEAKADRVKWILSKLK